MERVYQEAVDLNDIPGAIVVAQDATGKFNYAKAIGHRTLLDGTKKPQEVDDVLNTYSSTKIITSIAVLQCVDKGLFTLDEDISRILPELGRVQVLTGFDDKDQPQYEDKKRPLTLDLLLTHSSGYCYDFEPLLHKWRSLRGEAPMTGTTVEELAGLPLIFQPGSDWAYGVGLDWAGKAVERATGKTLEEHFHEHIFRPLGIRNASFWPLTNESIRSKMIDLNPDDPRGAGKAGMSGYFLEKDLTDCIGGGGCYISTLDFVKILSSVLANDEKLLKRQTVNLMFEPHLSTEAHKAFNEKLQDASWNESYGQDLPIGMTRDFGYGGLLVQDAQPGWLQEGTMVWGGGAALTWFIDRRSGLCGMGAPQYYMRDVPKNRKPGEEPRPWRDGGMIYEDLTKRLKHTFRKGIYEVYEEWKKGQK